MIKLSFRFVGPGNLKEFCAAEVPDRPGIHRVILHSAGGSVAPRQSVMDGGHAGDVVFVRVRDDGRAVAKGDSRKELAVVHDGDWVLVVNGKARL